MSDCGCGIKEATEEQRGTLQVALGLNAAMFVIGGIAGLLAHSSGLLADALDMLADAMAYGIALMAMGRSGRFKGRAAAFSGTLLLVLGVSVLADVVRRALGGEESVGATMMAVAAVSLLVNGYVLYRLTPFRQGEVHLRATWLFTRMDVVANLGVILSGAVVAMSGWRFADLIIGTAIGGYVIREALEILRSAREGKDIKA